MLCKLTKKCKKKNVCLHEVAAVGVVVVAAVYAVLVLGVVA